MIYYVYKCPEGHIFEKPSVMKDRNLPQECPVCKGKSKRIITSPNMIMKEKPGANIIDKSPMANVNDGLPNDL